MFFLSLSCVINQLNWLLLCGLLFAVLGDLLQRIRLLRLDVVELFFHVWGIALCGAFLGECWPDLRGPVAQNTASIMGYYKHDGYVVFGISQCGTVSVWSGYISSLTDVVLVCYMTYVMLETSRCVLRSTCSSHCFVYVSNP